MFCSDVKFLRAYNLFKLLKYSVFIVCLYVLVVAHQINIYSHYDPLSRAHPTMYSLIQGIINAIFHMCL